MGHTDVVFSRIFVVVDDVALELRVRVIGKEAGSGSHGHHGNIEEIGCAPHHPVAGASPPGHHSAAAGQVGGGFGDDEGQADRVAGGWRRVGHSAGSVRRVLHIIQAGDGLGAVGQAGKGGDIGDALAVQPDFAGLFAQAVQILGAGSGGHSRAPLRWTQAGAAAIGAGRLGIGRGVRR